MVGADAIIVALRDATQHVRDVSCSTGLSIFGERSADWLGQHRTQRFRELVKNLIEFGVMLDMKVASVSEFCDALHLILIGIATTGYRHDLNPLRTQRGR